MIVVSKENYNDELGLSEKGKNKMVKSQVETCRFASYNRTAKMRKYSNIYGEG